MLPLKKIIVSFCLISSSLSLSAEVSKSHPTHEKMKSHLDIIRNILDAGYAPVKWKESRFGWTLDEKINLAKDKIDLHGRLSVKDFQKIVRDFFMSMHDLHVSARFHSTESATLPFLVKGVDERYFITHVDNSMLSPSIYRIEKGDELVTFDGKPTHDVVLSLQQEFMSTEDEGTDRAITEMFLTNRKGAQAHDVPQGSVMIGIRKIGQKKIYNMQLTWDYVPELISNHYKININQDQGKPVFERNMFKLLMVSAYQDFFKSLCIDDQECGQRPGSRKSFLPSLGKKWWTSSKNSTFYAYLYENESGNLIGYVRIPHYMGSTEEVLEFAEMMAYFEERSDALVIDQVNNPGGSLFYMCALAALLTDQPLDIPKHHIAINQEYVAQAVELIPLFENISGDDEAQSVLGNSFYGHPVTHQMAKFFLNYFRFIVNEWEAGRILTKATHLYGFDKINPNPYGSYSKPILILVNELSISCGDFFPAILQDNKRAIVMGAKTSGAGGFVLPAKFPNLLGLNYFNYTGSIAERIDKSPIENLGVTPDIPYKITSSDLQYNYSSYVKKINEAVLETLYREQG